MSRLRTLWGRVPWGSRHWTQEPLAQGVGGVAIPLVGLPRERALAADAARETALEGIARERALIGGTR